MPKGVTVDIKVGAFIHDWVMAYRKSDLIRLDKTSNMWAILKQNLTIRPNDYSFIRDRSEYIAIELLETHAEKCYNAEEQQLLCMNELYRCYLSERGQACIRRYLENQFRAHFHVYMVARFSDEASEPIRHAIASFLSDYLLPVDGRMISRLSKDWYRFRQKNPENYPIPIFF